MHCALTTSLHVYNIRTNVCVLKTQLFLSEIFVNLYSSEGGSNKHEYKAAQQSMQVGHTFYHCSREREANVFDHKGCNSNGTNEECCLLMRLRHQPKQSLDRGTIFMRGCLSLCCPARPGTFLITIQSLSVYTISGAEWTVAQGSPWEALEAPPCPAFSLPPPSLPPSQTVHAASPNNPTPAHTHKHTQCHGATSSLPHTSTEAMRECVTSLRFLSLADTEAFCGWSLHHQGTISCSQGRGAAHGPC